jgi:hypothetical protein
VSGFQVYLDARGAEATSGKNWDDADKLTEIAANVRTDIGRAYRFLDGIQARIGELRGPVTLPKRPGTRTEFQRGYAAGLLASGVVPEKDEAA